MRIHSLVLIMLVSLFAVLPQAHSELKTENVILITYDGLRHQEVFGGIDGRLIEQSKQQEQLREQYVADTPEQEREELLPFLWSTIALQGQIWGNLDTNSEVVVVNKQVFSYPGYNEILTGRPNPEITSNAKENNKNVTVLEWVNQQPGFKGRVEAFASWDVFPYIINEERSGVPVNAGWELFSGMGDPEKQKDLNMLTRELPQVWDSVRYDVITFEGALDALVHRKPKLLYVAFGETDDWAHDGRYDLYIESAKRTDGYIQRIWETVQSMPEYAGKTTLIITSDHGRGDTDPTWKSHGVDIEGAEYIWAAMLGPDTPSKGVLKDTRTTQGQVAATAAALLGLDFNAAYPEAAASLLDGGK